MKTFGRICAALALCFAAEMVIAQTAPAPAAPAALQNVYAGGVSYNPSGTPGVAGTALQAHLLAATGTYEFTALDALPSATKPFTVTTNVGAGIAQRVLTIGNIPIYVPTDAGISFNGTNTGWQWSGGGLASINVKGNYYVMPAVRFLKSNVSGNSGYQLIASVLFAWGK